MITSETKETQHLSLRPVIEEDAGSVWLLHSDARTNIYNPAGPMTDRSQAEEQAERGRPTGRLTGKGTGLSKNCTCLKWSSVLGGHSGDKLARTPGLQPVLPAGAGSMGQRIGQRVSCSRCRAMAWARRASPARRLHDGRESPLAKDCTQRWLDETTRPGRSDRRVHGCHIRSRAGLIAIRVPIEGRRKTRDSGTPVPYEVPL